ncbi:MAG: hypothetical protein ACTIJ6_09940 [Leucobacter sp.]
MTQLDPTKWLTPASKLRLRWLVNGIAVIAAVAIIVTCVAFAVTNANSGRMTWVALAVALIALFIPLRRMVHRTRVGGRKPATKAEWFELALAVTGYFLALLAVMMT